MSSALLETWPNSRTLLIHNVQQNELESWTLPQRRSNLQRANIMHESSHLGVWESTTWGILIKAIDAQWLTALYPLHDKIEFLQGLRFERILHLTSNDAHEFHNSFLNSSTQSEHPFGLEAAENTLQHWKDAATFRKLLWSSLPIEQLNDIGNSIVDFQNRLTTYHDSITSSLGSGQNTHVAKLRPSARWTSRDLDVRSSLWRRPDRFMLFERFKGHTTSPEIDAPSIGKIQVTGSLIFENLALLASAYGNSRMCQNPTSGLPNGALYTAITDWIQSQLNLPFVQNARQDISEKVFISDYGLTIAILTAALCPPILPGVQLPSESRTFNYWTTSPFQVIPGWRLVQCVDTLSKNPNIVAKARANTTPSELTEFFDTLVEMLDDSRIFDLLTAHYMGTNPHMQRLLSISPDPLFLTSERFDPVGLSENFFQPINRILASNRDTDFFEFYLFNDACFPTASNLDIERVKQEYFVQSKIYGKKYTFSYLET